MAAHESIVLEAALVDHAPPVATKNPFKKTAKKPATVPTHRRLVGAVQLVARNETSVVLAAGESPSTAITTYYFLRFVDVRISNEKKWPLFVLLSRAAAPLGLPRKGKRSASDETLLRTLEAQGELVPLDVGPGGQWAGAQLPKSFEQLICVYDPLAFASVMICKPSAARPTSALPQVVAHGVFSSYMPPEKSPEQVQAELDALTFTLQSTVMEMDEVTLNDDQLDLDALQRNARELFKLFDQDKSNSIDFDEYKQMLAYRGVNLLDSKAMRLFQLVDDQKKGYIDEREFVLALYITNTLRLNAAKQQSNQALSPVDIFYQIDSDRDGLLNVFEFEKAMQLLGITRGAAVVKGHFPKGAAAITMDQFKAVWLNLIDVREELRKRGITPRSTASTDAYEQVNVADQNPVLSNSQSGKRLAIPTVFGSKTRQRQEDRQKLVLMEWITQVEHEELEQALQAKNEVSSLEKARREQVQEEKRSLFAQHRQTETATRTNEALRERQEKIQRRKERVVKERQAKEEKKLLLQITEEEQKRTVHQQLVVQELIASKMEKIVNQKAMHGDDVLDLSFRQLEVIPPTYFKGKDAIDSLSSLLIMSVSGNRLKELPSAIFTHLFALQVLDLSDNLIERLPDEIGELRDLKTLDVRHNQLTSLPLQLKLLRQLTVLNLAHNRLERFADLPIKDSNRRESYCAGLVALEDLDLSYNQALTDISDTIRELEMLKVFRLRGCTALKRLPDAFHDLRNLVVFDMFGSQQKRIGKHVFGEGLSSLRSVSLAFNSLTSLPDATGKLPNLQELDVSNNALMAFPECVTSLRELVVFRGARNKMDRLPERIGELSCMECLDLSRNALRSPLPPGLGLLTYLQFLDLQHNRLTELPTEVGALINVQELNLSWNEICVLPEEMGCMVSLKKLNLSHNKLTTLPHAIVLWQELELLVCSHNEFKAPLTTSVSQLLKLHYLDLSFNLFSSIEPCVYALPALEVLTLSGNKILLLPRELERSPAGLSLKKLDLYNNKIVAIPVEWSDFLSRLDVFSIGRNPMSRLTQKWSDHWRGNKWQRGDVYASSSMNGYTPCQVSEWVHDTSIVYPTIVTVWTQDPLVAGSDAFVDSVRAAIGSDMWQHRFERIVKHYFYEFKYVGHEIAFEEIPEERRAAFEAAETRLRDQRQQRAKDAIAQNNGFRDRLVDAYAFDSGDHHQSMEKRRRAHQVHLLRDLQTKTQQWNEVVSAKLPGAVERHDALVFDRKKRFADEMKEAVRQRALDKQQVVQLRALGERERVVAISEANRAE